jgi:hypothetical protein
MAQFDIHRNLNPAKFSLSFSRPGKATAFPGWLNLPL